jgi:hypothetical protein
MFFERNPRRTKIGIVKPSMIGDHAFDKANEVVICGLDHVQDDVLCLFAPAVGDENAWYTLCSLPNVSGVSYIGEGC